MFGYSILNTWQEKYFLWEDLWLLFSLIINVCKSKDTPYNFGTSQNRAKSADTPMTTRLYKEFIKIRFRKKCIIKENVSQKKYEWTRDSLEINAQENS